MKQIGTLIGLILALGTCPEAIGQVKPLAPVPLGNTTPRQVQEPDPDETLIVLEQRPVLIEEGQTMQKLMKYPAEAYANGIEGVVMLQVLVDEQGQVEDVVVEEGIGGGCDEEAARVVRQLRFRPGIQAGKFDGVVGRRAVKAWTTLSVQFTLPDPSN